MVTEPVAAVNGPTPWSIEPETAPAEVQVRVAELPCEMVVGEIVNEQVGAAASTVTVAKHWAVPPAPVAVAVYVVVAEGVCTIEPVTIKACEPIP